MTDMPHAGSVSLSGPDSDQVPLLVLSLMLRLLHAGYLLYDTSNIVVFFKYLGDVSAIIHHMIFTVATTYVLVHSIMAFPFVWLALGEMSTPFVNLR